jgi:hypothetical protein
VECTLKFKPALGSAIKMPGKEIKATNTVLKTGILLLQPVFLAATNVL